MSGTLRVLVADDEPLARARLRTLLADCRDPAARLVAEAAHATDVVEFLRTGQADVILLDIHMPGKDGLQLAHILRQHDQPPAIVFVTAHAEYAVQAFELDAVDYLTKPVRLERLQQALQKVQRAQRQGTQDTAAAAGDEAALLIQERGRSERVPLDEVLYLKAELKYVTVRTQARSFILDGSLSELEEKFPRRFVRVHRNALVARSALRSLVRHVDPEEGEGWAVQLRAIDELLSVSRRQLAAVREAMGASS